MTELRLSRRAVVLGALPAACGLSAQPAPSVPDIAALRKTTGVGLAADAEMLVTDALTGGRFRWDPLSTVEDDGGIVIAPGRGRGRWVRLHNRVIDAGWFGASPRASARTNSVAFAAASAAINRAGGGTLLVPPGEYRVGYQQPRQPRGSGTAVLPGDVIRIEGCSRPVVLTGAGVKFRAANGLKYGAFDPVTGRRYDSPTMPFIDLDYRADGWRMIYIRHCSGSVRIEGFELDGNMQNYELGGQWGDTGRQLVAAGIMLDGNTGGVVIADVVSHDHGLDGIWVAHYHLTADSPRYPVTLIDVVCDRNGRQGLSWVGGTELTALRCRFSRTGKGRFISAPAAGVDIEAELSVCRNGRFIDCEFSDNAGVGFLVEVGDVAHVSVERCRIIGTTSYSSWSRKPHIVFRECLFVGSIVNAFGDADPGRATKFLSCRFSADVSLSPTGEVYGAYLADLGGGATNVLMSDCDFEAISDTITLPWTLPDIRYHDCRFRQTGTGISHPRGVYSGTCRIDTAGPIDLYGSRFLGRVFLNGQLLT